MGLSYLSTEGIGDYLVSVRVETAPGDQYEFENKSISELGETIEFAPAQLDLKKVFRMERILYRLKWKLESGSVSTGQYDVVKEADEFECVNLNFRGYLGKDAAAAAVIGGQALEAAPARLFRDSLVVGMFPGLPLFLFDENSELLTNWPFTDFEEDVRQPHARQLDHDFPNGSISAVLHSVFSGMRRGLRSGVHYVGAANINNHFLQLFTDASTIDALPDPLAPGTDLSGETANPATFNTFNSNFDQNLDASVRLYYREYWRIVRGL